ncbi:hypothetical protein BD413DRAFT_475768 [Trametes elegans]|nr:hypothetical protein BD413DRAFT_475768 [Trametes elegans]
MLPTSPVKEGEGSDDLTHPEDDVVIATSHTKHEAPPFQARAPLSSALPGLSLPSTSAIVQLAGQQLPTPTSPGAPEIPRTLGMPHMPLIYIIASGKMTCRMCKARCEDPQIAPARPYVIDEKTASWDDMVGHCEREHPMSFEGLLKMSPAQIRAQDLVLNGPLAARRRYA